MIDRNPRGLVMDLVNSGVYDEDFELVWANKRDEDEPYPPHPDTPNTPNFGENPKPNSETIRLWDSATTHTSSALAVTKSFGKAKEEKRRVEGDRGEPVTGMGAIVNGMGIRRQGNGNGGNGGDPEASWPEMKRNPSISNSETGSERALDARDEKTIRPPSTSTISSGWGDGLSIHSLEMNENEPVQGLGIRPQSRQPPTPYESNNEIVSHGHKTTYPHNPFADPPQPPTYSIPKLSPVLIPSFEIERYRNAYGVTPTGDMIHEYIQSLNANTGRTAPPSLTSELDALERQREMEGGHIGGEIPQPNGSRWSNPFTRRGSGGERGRMRRWGARSGAKGSGGMRRVG
ncbi:hypothetical protein DID88_005130 [Monilinia fructigena]|uniref:Uncharacterized protein n=1 Tax=Monilinia fructigena TaxID=38457 RepID=A0A395IDH8_9HELO|nr:hypothetical protein DID88_005130 [Monilinia fructigena]